MKYLNHLNNGYVKVLHRDKETVTNLNSEEFESFLEVMDDMDYTVGRIPPGFEHRADRISDLFYNTPTLDWLICWFNNIKDPFNQLNLGDRLLIPKIL